MVKKPTRKELVQMNVELLGVLRKIVREDWLDQAPEYVQDAVDAVISKGAALNG